jgi:aminoglycoside phosphotransferase (APT) family kinase protein
MSDDPLGLARCFVPGKQAPRLRLHHDGVPNRCYWVERDDARFAMRVSPVSGGRSESERRWECRLLALTSAAGLSPAVSACDPVRGILVTRWIEGEVWEADYARSPEALVRIADMVRKIQSLAAPPAPRAMTPRAWIDYYESGAVAGENRGPLAAAADRHLIALEGMPRVAQVLCHSDLHRRNIVDDAGKCTVLDWEYAHWGDAWWDLASWSAMNELRQSNRSALLAAYLNRAPSQAQLKRLDTLTWLYDYVCLLWLKRVSPDFAPRAQIEERLMGRN